MVKHGASLIPISISVTHQHPCRLLVKALSGCVFIGHAVVTRDQQNAARCQDSAPLRQPGLPGSREVGKDGDDVDKTKIIRVERELRRFPVLKHMTIRQICSQPGNTWSVNVTTPELSLRRLGREMP